MSNQIQITSGAKVRNLEGVLTGDSGIISSLPINASLGIPQLDVNGKILVDQLPNSIMEYKGTWNAATNTPTLANGTGNQGDVYLCNVAGTVNFGAGPIVFFVGDQVIYSGTIWQRASGATGTVTSVSITESGDALTITGSPITTSGTINIGFTGNSGQYVNGAGGLTTFPSLNDFVTLSTNQTITAEKTFGTDVTFNGYALMDIGVALAKTSGTPLYGSTNGYANLQLVNAGSVNSLFLIDGDTLKYSKLSFNNAADYTYTFPASSGTVALTSNLSSYVPYIGATTNVNLGTFDLTADVITGATGSFASSGSGNTFAINHSSGSGIALNITKGGNGEALVINKTSGSGNALSVTGTTLLTGVLSGTTATFSGLGTFNQLTITGATAGRIFYAQTGGVVSQSGNLNWDETNGMLGVGTPNPSAVITAFSTNAATQFKAAGTAPAFTFSNTLTSPTLGCVFGLATGSNQFVTGTAAGDMAIANQSTVAGAIVFGTGTTERMRMSAAGRFLINTSVDNGASLQVNGAATLTGALSGTSATFSSSVTATGLNLTTGGSTAAVFTSSGTNVYSSLSFTNTTTGYGYDIGFGGSASIAPNSFYIYGGSSASVKLAITSGGRVVINDTVGDTFFNINTKSSAQYNPNTYNGVNAGIRMGNGSAGEGKYTGLALTGGGSTEGFFGVVQNSSGLAEFVWQTFNGSAYGERMRITSGGQLQVRQDALFGLDFSSTQYVAISENQIRRLGNGTLFINNSNTGDVSININGGGTFVNGTNGYGRAVTNSSDERIKKNITTIDNALSKVLQMNGVYYEFNNENELGVNVPSGNTRIGLIAQQVESILPEAVFTSSKEDEPKSIDYNGMIGLLINAIQEQDAKIEELKALIAAK